jgi:hypothetical protein
MIFSQAQKYEEIVRQLDRESDVISLVGCETCVRVAGSATREMMKELALRLRKDGYTVRDGFMVPSACNPKLGFVHLQDGINTVVCMACSAGASNMHRMFPDCKVVETVEDVGLMIEDSETETLHITMPYAAHVQEKDALFQAFTGEKKEANQ